MEPDADEVITALRHQIERLRAELENSISKPYADELGRQIEELEAENAKLRAALQNIEARTGTWMEGANEPEFTRFGIVEAICHNTLADVNEQAMMQK